MNNLVKLNNYNFPVVSNYYNYKSFALSIPNLEEKEEIELFNKFQYENCVKSAQKLIMSQLKTVIYIAQQFKNYGLSEEDLVQEGNIGLMKAVKNFDVSQKVRLYTYSILWIKAEMQSYILKNWKIIKIATTKNLKKLFFNFRSIQKEMIDLNIDKKELTSIISKKLNVDIDDVKEIEKYFNNDEISIDYDDENNQVFQLEDNSTPETIYIENKTEQDLKNQLNIAFKGLNENQRKVIQLRYYEENKKTHKEISQILGVSSERVRQIENEALKKIKEQIKTA